MRILQKHQKPSIWDFHFFSILVSPLSARKEEEIEAQLLETLETASGTLFIDKTSVLTKYEIY